MDSQVTQHVIPRIGFLLGAMKKRMNEVVTNGAAAFKDTSGSLHCVSRADMVTGVRIPGGFCWTSTLHPKCSVRFVGRGDGHVPTLHSLREFLDPVPWKIEEFEGFLHIHERPDQSIVAEMRKLDAHAASLYPDHVSEILKMLPANSSPMTMFAVALQAMESESYFLEMKRQGYACVENMLALSMYDAQVSRAWTTRVIAEIYYRCRGLDVPERVKVWMAEDSWVKNLARMLGGGEDLENWLSFYMITNSDNEGGNASMHAMRLCSSTEASFFASAASCCQALSGRRHGDAVADAYCFMQTVFSELNEMSEDELGIYMSMRKQGDKGFRWPGLGHGVFQVPDERFILQCQFAQNSGISKDPFFDFMRRVAKAGSKTFSKPGKMVFPNVDFASGAIHAHFFGDDKPVMEWFTCLFLLSRLIGGRAQATAERGLNLPIERPSTLSLFEMLGHVVPDQEIQDLSCI